ILGGATTVTGSILGAAWIRGIPYAFGSRAGLLSSAFGVLVVLLVFPSGLAGLAFRVREFFVRRVTGQRLEETIAAVDTPRARLPARPQVGTGNGAGEPIAIGAADVVVRFGGNVAVDHVSVHAKPRE